MNTRVCMAESVRSSPETITLLIGYMLVAQLCPGLCDPLGCSSPRSSVHRILQARILEWVAFHFSSGPSQPRSPAIQNKKLEEEYIFIAHVEADFLVIELITMFQ